MRKLNKIISILPSFMIFAGLSVNSVDASAGYINAYPCNNCTASQKLAVASSKAIDNPGSNIEVYVYDMTNNTLDEYEDQYYIFNGHQINGAVYIGPMIGSGDNTTFENYRTIFIANGDSETVNKGMLINLPSPISNNPDGSPHDDGYINTYDVLTIDAANYSVTSCLSSYSCSFSFTQPYTALNASMLQLLQTVKSSIINFNGLTDVVTVTFPDGSSITYSYNPKSAKYEPVSGTSYDSHHNLISIQKPSGHHTYVGGPGGAPYDMQNIGILWGTPNDDNGEDYGGCSSESWDGETLTCIHQD